MLTFLKHLPAYIAIQSIKAYQKTLSFDHGILKVYYPYGYCKFRPTCSEYAISAVEKHGFLKGGLISIWRLARCNPWSKGGHDPLK